MAIGSGTSARNIGIWGYQQAQDAIGKGQGILDQAQGNALASLGKGYGQARDDLNTQYTGAIGRLDPYNQAGLKGLGMYQNSLGLNGASGNADAVAAFQASPGYQWQVDQATDAAARKASATGALGSGNTMAAIATLGSNLANQEYGGWQDRLNGLGQQGQQAATTQAGLQGQLGSQLAGLGTQQGRDESGVFTGLAGLGVNNLWQGTNAGLGAVSGAQKAATDSVNSGYSLGLNAIGSGLGLLGLPMGGGATLGGNMLNFARGR